MPRDRLLTGVGFAGGVTDVCFWLADNVPWEAERILNCFGGVGRYNSILSEEHRIIDSWDTQIMGPYLNDGVFMSTELKRNVLEPKGTRGYAYEERIFDNLDDKSAGLIDYIAENGSSAEKAALAMSFSSLTQMGRLGYWQATPAKLWHKWQDTIHKLEAYLDMPGTIRMHYGDMFSDELGDYDVVFYDPPVLKGGKDTYSSNTIYSKIDKLIGGKGRQPVWDIPHFFANLRFVLDLPIKLKIVKYTGGMNPSSETFKNVLEEYGQIVQEDVLSNAQHLYILRSP